MSMYLLVKPASGACNLQCRYCFYADEMKHRVHGVRPFMTEERFARLLYRAAEHLQKRNDRVLSIGFQGGEPTLVGLPFFRRAVALTKEIIPPSVKVDFYMQTNGLCIDDAFAAFFAENNFLVGLSLDGTREINDRLRVDGQQKGSHSEIIHAIRLLKQYHCQFNILTVVTAELARHPVQVYNYYKKQGLQYQQYIPCIPGFEETPQPHTLTPESYGKFLCTLFDLWYQDFARGEMIVNREFENYVGILCNLYPEECGKSGRCAVQYVVEADGSVYPCDFYALDAYLLGNIDDNSFDQMDEQVRRIGFVERSIPLPEECMQCSYGVLCRGGCYRYRDAAGKNILCEAYSMFFAYTLPRLQKLAQYVKRRK